MSKTSVKLIADSVSAYDTSARISTFEIIQPRIIHAEFMTHRMFSRNASSSRAVPILTQIMYILSYFFIPTHFPKNNKGMSPERSLNRFMNFFATVFYYIGAYLNIFGSLLMKALGVHKEIANRQTEYFSYIKVLVTATEWDNFLELRTHSAAQKEIRTVANMIKALLLENTPEVLQIGEWHTPYVDHYRNDSGVLLYGTRDKANKVKNIGKYDAIAVSVSCAAQTSYRSSDMDIHACTKRYERFKKSVPKHSSPFEHCATPAHGRISFNGSLHKGVTHIDTEGNQWSGNLKAWIQLRQSQL